MKIWKEKDGSLNTYIWRADFRYKNKRYRPKAFTKADLEEIITGIKSNADRSRIGLADRSAKITLAELRDEHEKELDLSLKTHRRTKVVIRQFVKFIGESLPVEDVLISHIRSYIRSRKEESALMPESVNKEIGMISAMLRDAPEYFKQLDGYKPPRMPWEKVPKNRTQRIIYKDEREALLAHFRFDGLHPNEKPSSRLARFEYGDMFELSLATALRWGELRHVTWGMVNLRKAEITLPVEVTKTDASRTVYLNSRAVEILKERKARTDSPYVFPGRTPDVPRQYYYEGIRRAANKLGLPFGRLVGFTPHSSRHTTITEILETTGDFAAAQAISGHSEKTFVLKYAHTKKDRIRAAVESLIPTPSGQKTDSEKSE